MKYFRLLRNNNLPLFGPMLQEAALQFAINKKQTEFKASNE